MFLSPTKTKRREDPVKKPNGKSGCLQPKDLVTSVYSIIIRTTKFRYRSTLRMFVACYDLFKALSSSFAKPQCRQHIIAPIPDMATRA